MANKFNKSLSCGVTVVKLNDHTPSTNLATTSIRVCLCFVIFFSASMYLYLLTGYCLSLSVLICLSVSWQTDATAGWTKRRTNSNSDSRIHLKSHSGAAKGCCVEREEYEDNEKGQRARKTNENNERGLRSRTMSEDNERGQRKRTTSEDDEQGQRTRTMSEDSEREQRRRITNKDNEQNTF